MTDREKLIELLEDLGATFEKDCGPDPSIPGGRLVEYFAPEDVVDHLIANGVTVQKWIPVTERLPALIPCNAGTAYSEAVNVLTSGRKVFTAIWDGIDFICDARFWEAEGEKITHWTPVLLPLPEPPKEDE